MQDRVCGARAMVDARAAYGIGYCGKYPDPYLVEGVRCQTKSGKRGEDGSLDHTVF
jgi:hypothetical protein